MKEILFLLLLAGLPLLDCFSFSSLNVNPSLKSSLGNSVWHNPNLQSLKDKADPLLWKGKRLVRTTASPRTMTSSSNSAKMNGLAESVRDDFPTLKLKVHGDKNLVYLDSAATSHKPEAVIEAMNNFYRTANSNVHRGAHFLSVKATEMYEDSREKVARFVNANRDEIVFTRGASEAINLVAYSWGMSNLKAGDEVIMSVMEHHSNLVPWQLVAQKTGAVLKFVQLNDKNCFDLDHYRSLLSPKTKIVATMHVSNMLGCINPVNEIISEAHKVGALVMLDACQSVPHMKIDVRALDCDFLVASAHKMCGPTGVGFLYGKSSVLKGMPPWQGGGEMIDEVFLEKSTYAEPPGRFEAGTPPIAECIGFGAACDYLSKIGMDKIHEHEVLLSNYLYDKLHRVAGVTVYGPKPEEGRAALAAFNHASIQHSDLSTFMDMEGVAIRSGHHCTQPLHRILGATGSCRASCYLYTTYADIDAFIDNLQGTIAMFASLDGQEE